MKRGTPGVCSALALAAALAGCASSPSHRDWETVEFQVDTDVITLELPPLQRNQWPAYRVALVASADETVYRRDDLANLLNQTWSWTAGLYEVGVMNVKLMLHRTRGARFDVADPASVAPIVHAKFSKERQGPACEPAPGAPTGWARYECAYDPRRARWVIMYAPLSPGLALQLVVGRDTWSMVDSPGAIHRHKTEANAMLERIIASVRIGTATP